MLDFTAIDFETANSYRGSPCSVGLVKVRDGIVVNEHYSLIRPPAQADGFDPFNIGIHGITPAMVADAPRWQAVLPQIMDFIGGDIVVAHNAQFDTGVIRYACAADNIAWPAIDFLCTLVLARRAFALPSYRLPFVTEACGITLEGHHDALADARAVVAIVGGMAAAGGVDTLQGLATLHGVRLGRMRSGSHAGPVGAYAGAGGVLVAADANPVADPDGHLYGRVVVFTGALTSMTRQLAWNEVVRAGGVPQENTTKRTNVLVLGSVSPAHLRPGATYSGKARRAFDLQGKGQDIELMTEDDFLQALGGHEVATAAVHASSEDRTEREPTVVDSESPGALPAQPDRAKDAASDDGIVLTDEFTRALTILESGGNLFLTGKAGTGKSTLIRHFIAGSERRVVVAAPTGIAALNVAGYTIHRLFSFQATTTLAEVRTGGYRPQRFFKTLKSLETLIIDEASMVRADLFDMLVAALERFGPRPGTPFGGVQVVLVGDLLQLPPVVTDGEAEYFTTRYRTPYFFSADSFRREDFPTVALTTVFRQLGDQRLTSLLNAVREGVLLEDARQELNARTVPDFVPPEDEFWLTLAPTNRIVTARNRRQLERLAGEELVHHARQSGDLSLFDPPVEERLSFKVGAQIMMLTNDSGERWVNGTLGRIAAVADDTEGVVAKVEFRDGSVAEVGIHTWEATRPVVEGGSLRHEVIGTYTQLPFKLAWAITIHKSQGQTLDRLIVDLSGGAFAYGQVYVALSRCTSMEGLVLTRPVLPKDLKTDRRIIRFLRAATADDRRQRHCALGVLTVGDEGRMSRPRPVEIAVAFDDGTAVSTVVNPQRDLANAREAYGISVGDVLLAPTLAEVWTVLAPILEGWTPVGVATDQALGLIDFELKRLGQVMPLPLGIDLPPGALRADELGGLSAGTALERARAALAAHARLGIEDPGASSFDGHLGADSSSTYLLTRNPEASPPSSVHLPSLSALLEISRELSAVLLTGLGAAEVQLRYHPDSEAAADPGLRALVAERLKVVVTRVAGVPAELGGRLRQVGVLLGADLAGFRTEAATPADLEVVLVPGARVCFTGTAQTPSGRVIERDDIHEMASARGLVPVKTVTKTKCDALVVAEVGTQSGKARKATELGKPVFSAKEFFAWLAEK